MSSVCGCLQRSKEGVVCLQVHVNHLIWVLGTKFRLSRKVASTLDYWDSLQTFKSNFNMAAHNMPVPDKRSFLALRDQKIEIPLTRRSWNLKVDAFYEKKKIGL